MSGVNSQNNYSARWAAVCQMLNRIGIKHGRTDRLESPFGRSGGSAQYRPKTPMGQHYHVVSRHFHSGPRRCYLLWRMEDVPTTQASIAYLQMIGNDWEIFVLKRGKS